MLGFIPFHSMRQNFAFGKISDAVAHQKLVGRQSKLHAFLSLRGTKFGKDGSPVSDEVQKCLSPIHKRGGRAPTQPVPWKTAEDESKIHLHSHRPFPTLGGRAWPHWHQRGGASSTKKMSLSLDTSAERAGCRLERESDWMRKRRNPIHRPGPIDPPTQNRQGPRGTSLSWRTTQDRFQSKPEAHQKWQNSTQQAPSRRTLPLLEHAHLDCGRLRPVVPLPHGLGSGPSWA